MAFAALGGAVHGSGRTRGRQICSRQRGHLVVHRPSLQLTPSGERGEEEARSDGEQPGREKMGVSFTCNVCDARVSKEVRRQSYTKGVVIIQCPSCESRHLIADHLGWYKDWTDTKMGTVEELMSKKGEKVIKLDPSKFDLEQ